MEKENKYEKINRSKTEKIDRKTNVVARKSQTTVVVSYVPIEGFFSPGKFWYVANLSRSYPYSEKNSVKRIQKGHDCSLGQVLIERFERLRAILGRNPELVEMLDAGFIREEIDLLEFVLDDVQAQESSNVIEGEDVELVIS